MARYLREKRDSRDPSLPAQQAQDGQLQARSPALHANLVETADEEGRPRATMTVLIFTEDGRWKCCLRDRHSNEVCFVTADGFDALLTQVEVVLSTGKGDWRESRESPARGKSR